MFKSSIRPAAVISLCLLLITGVAYPMLVTGIAQAVFPHQARGSLITRDDKPIGSALIGQTFTEPQYFWGRPSATATQPNNPLASGGSNQGPLNPALIENVRARIAILRNADPQNNALVPVDLVTASASGLDPDISLAAANYQAGRVARARALDESNVRAVIESHAQRPWLSLFGEPHVNVLTLNLVLDERSLKTGS